MKSKICPDCSRPLISEEYEGPNKFVIHGHIAAEVWKKKILPVISNPSISARQAARWLDIDHEAIRRWRRKYLAEIKFEHEMYNKGGINTKHIAIYPGDECLRSMLKQGYSPIEISRELGFAYTTIKNWLRKLRK